MPNSRIKYTANIGIGTISFGNPNRDGTGTLVSIITGASNGTLVERVFIKATGNTSSGMVRLFCYLNSSNIMLFKEVPVKAVVKSSSDNSFYYTLDLNFKLAPGYQLLASTQNSETFIVTAEGLDFSY